MGEVKIKSGNLANGELEQGGVSISGGSVSSAARVRGYANVKPLTAYTITANKAFRLCYGYNYDGLNLERVGLIFDDNSGNNKLSAFTTPEGCNYIRFALWNGDESNIIPTDIQNLNLVEGTYTSETIPEYQPYFLNRPAHQVTNGQFVDIPTHHYINGRWQGELTSQSPLKFWADGDMLDWRIEGRTSGNLFDVNGDYSAYMHQGSPTCRVDNGQIIVNVVPYYFAHIKFSALIPSGQYTIKCKASANFRAMRLLLTKPFDTGTWNGSYQRYYADMVKNDNYYTYTFTVDEDFAIGFAISGTTGDTGAIDEIMLNEGSTALPYEPYGGVGDWDETTQRYRISIQVEGENLYTIPIGEDLWGDNVSASHRNNNGELIIVMGTGNDSGVYSRAGSTIGAAHNALSNGSWSVEIKADSPMNLRIGFQADGAKYIDITAEYQKFTFDNQSFTYGTSFIIYNRTGVANTVYLRNFEIYFDNTVNLYTDHQLMEGDSIDYATDQTAIPIATGNNILTVDTAVQPSKVFVKFEG